MTTQFQLPKKYKELSELPIGSEVMALEYDLEDYMQKKYLSKTEEEIVRYLFKRCNKLWKKLQLRDSKE